MTTNFDGGSRNRNSIDNFFYFAIVLNDRIKDKFGAFDIRYTLQMGLKNTLNRTYKKRLIIIHPLAKGELPKADFWALLSVLKSNSIHYQLITNDITGALSPAVDGYPIYLHITDVTYLHKLNGSLSYFKKNNSLIITGGKKLGARQV